MTQASEIVVGTQLPERRITEVSADHIKMVALILRDSNPIHFDLEAVSRAGLGSREVNQGGATMAYVLDLLTEWAGSRQALREISCAFRANVFAGDDVLVGGEVTSVTSDENGRLVNCALWAETNGKRAIVGSATVVLPAH
ncbi:MULTISPECIES: MaoC/PaaZ C-terminal domain-containing protein [unclassified Mycobacterium]|uniref:MaoC/PaaZ C-terminal domain-containing protein n=1 Tax=unclassified Mycobacterium TaxID=2642494 RepID=UPI00048DC5F4|nr:MULTISPECIES: MaoC/PaaZ C-terminal domain-containing protein [unclassified Mycobacterium]SEA61786.1 Acyl dehydratase [Mycobacterium sp. 283mftsu]